MENSGVDPFSSDSLESDLLRSSPHITGSLTNEPAEKTHEVARPTRRSNLWITGLGSLATVAVAIVTLGVVLATKESIDKNAPAVEQRTTGSIDTPYNGLLSDSSDAQVLRGDEVCGFSGHIVNLPPNNQLWLMELQYYRAATATSSYNPRRVLYSPSDFPMTISGGSNLPSSGYSGAWHYQFPTDGNCMNPLFVGYHLATDINRYAIFLVSMTSSDSGLVRQYNITKAKGTYVGVKLPPSSRIMDEVDVVQCPLPIAKRRCLADAPR